MNIDKQEHLELVALYIYSKSFNSFSLKTRIAVDLGYLKMQIASYSKEVDALSDEEILSKLKQLKTPWWNDAYGKYLKNNRKLLLAFLYIPFMGKIYLWWKSRKNNY